MQCTESEEESSDSEDEDETPSAPLPSGGLQTPSGLDTPSGLSSVTSTVPGGIETPDFLDLRKRRDGTETDEGPRSLYQVLPERESRMRGLMGSERVYDVSAISGAPAVLGQEEQRKVRPIPFIPSIGTDGEGGYSARQEESRSRWTRISSRDLRRRN